jgi:hypothetical protein
VTVAASCRSERPFADGNCPVEGCSAAGSSETADGSACVDAVEIDEVVVVVVAAAALVEVADVALEDEEPHPAIAQPTSANAMIGATRRADEMALSVIMAVLLRCRTARSAFGGSSWSPSPVIAGGGCLQGDQPDHGGGQLRGARPDQSPPAAQRLAASFTIGADTLYRR